MEARRRRIGSPNKRPEPSDGDHGQGPSRTYSRSPHHRPERRAAAFPSGARDRVVFLLRPRYGVNLGVQSRGRGDDQDHSPFNGRQNSRHSVPHFGEYRSEEGRDYRRHHSSYDNQVVGSREGRGNVAWDPLGPVERPIRLRRGNTTPDSWRPSRSSSPGISADEPRSPGAADKGAEEGQQHAFGKAKKRTSKSGHDRVEKLMGDEAPEAGSSGGALPLADKSSLGQGGEGAKLRSAGVKAEDGDKGVGLLEENEGATSEGHRNKLKGGEKSLPTAKLPVGPEKASVEAVEEAEEVG
ncbi:hypothetical protein GGTG_11025 [Gaeumannomyces tritici R3-111a-1]|uniref:Uncharacterized protein n=1 Tax=Gaeumannomyces tritici (strain R3-111a-1) TaxID=644352 RepID=J3PC01_GAET3|nr:hypothetical protein GGTG_11025 [Gaeumannomyces tritici R3-111a-1]EJT71771.1 hypothetical protein GGTG_11025 [Gaeumannomyces tritici R3-111a-1]